MPIYTDQTIAGNFDPGVPPPLPVTITVVTMTIDDADGDGLIRPNSGDTINGSIVNAVWVGDTVTINGVTHHRRDLLHQRRRPLFHTLGRVRPDRWRRRRRP
jgi:hypothetical protein